MKSIAFYNAKAGVGCTSLVYHLAWMYSDLGYRVVAVDADPQGDLSGLLLGFDVFRWVDYDEQPETGASIGNAILYGVSSGVDFITSITPGLGLVLADLDQEEWIAENTRAHGLCFSGSRSAIPDDLASSRVRRMVAAIGRDHAADVMLIDVGPGLGVCSCLAVTAADAVVFPVTADHAAVRGLQESVRTAKRWRVRWEAYTDRVLDPTQVQARRDRDASLPGEPIEQIEQADVAWLRPPPTFLGHVVTGDAHYGGATVRPQLDARRLEEAMANLAPEAAPELGKLTRWVALRDMWLQHRKPMFALSPADGAVGSTAKAVQRCRAEYQALATSLAGRLGLRPSGSP